MKCNALLHGRGGQGNIYGLLKVIFGQEYSSFF